MDVKLMFLTVVLLSSPLLTLSTDPLYVLLAPNLLRVGSSENVFVEAQDYFGKALEVKIKVLNYPKKNTEIQSKSVILTEDNNFQNLTDIKITDDKKMFSNDPLEKQYVYLQAMFPSYTLEKVIMLSFQTGYIFVQTDKPIYTPASTVLYRIFSLMPNLKPLNNISLTVEIKNPQGITVSSDKIHAVKEIKSGKYAIPDVASPGIWKVVTHFSDTPQKTFTADFEVKDYVLPTFEVQLKPSKSFFYVGDESLTVDIEANYLFGQKVDGNAIVVFGVMDGEKKTSIPASLKRVPIEKGKGTAKLTKESITKTFPDVNQLVGQSIYVSVSLLTESGSEMVEAQRRGIQIVTSPYTIQFRKTSHYFKPGRPFDAMIYATNPDQTPAVNVEVEVKVNNNPEVYRQPTNDKGIAKFTINTKGGSSTLEITAKTKDSQLRDEQQAEKMMIAQAYKTKDGSNNYLHISIDTTERKIGDSVKVNLNTGQSPGVRGQDFTYMILSKGQILQVYRFKRDGQSLVSQTLLVTKDMVPSFRFVAYYHVGLNEVVSDSVWVDVMDTCKKTLKLELEDKVNIYGPGDEVQLKITGDPGAKVGLVVVDKAVNVLNKNRLTQTQIWDVIEKHDTGCTAGGGRDSMGVFTDAGLMFESSTAGGTNTRTVPECPVPAKRKRRAESHLQITSTLAGKYSGELKQCCVDGMRDNILGYTCEQRATYIVDGEECVNVFLYCCNQIKTNKDMMTEEEEMIMARSEDDEYYIDSEEITSRTVFPESWFWKEIDLPACEKCETSSITEKPILKDSITTWQILAVSLSTLGICVAEPKEMVVFKSFFIDLKMPYSAVRGEQLEIKTIIHNYSQNKLKARVEFMETKDICSSASNKGKYRIKVNVANVSSQAISYVIIPMELGDYTIEVKASAQDYTDGVKKTLKVVSEGVLKHLQRENMELNPVKNGNKSLVFKYETPDDQLPGTDANTYISITGEEIAQTVKRAIDGEYIGSLIAQPTGCGEQTMFGLTMLVTATNYLDSTNQWDTVGVDRRNEAIKYINSGYQRQLGFRKSDGSYASYRDNLGSTWLTAYVSKIFAMANKLVTLKYDEVNGEDLLCSTLKWLVLKQTKVGSFKEDSPVIHSAIMGDDADVSLTAYVVIAMQEGKEMCAEAIKSLHQKISKAVDFLEDRISRLKNPYAVALMSYAMANENKLNKDILIKHSTKGQDDRHWAVPGEYFHSQEATAYAVLALLKAKELDTAEEAVRWLVRQQSYYGGYGTTQATVMAFQAIAEYRTQVKDRQDFNLEVDLSMAKRGKPVKYVIRRNNAHLTRSDRVAVSEGFSITAKGSGKAMLSILTLYYARPTEKKSDCTFFDLTVKMEKKDETKQEAIETYKLTMDFMYKKSTTDATMTILDIGIPTGFTADIDDLKALSTGKDRYLQKYENNTELSDRGSLILYLDKVSNENPEKIAFRMHKMFNVGLLQPAAVTIYEYYSPGKRCTKFYHPERNDGAIYRLCKGDLCQCAEEGCSYQRKHVEDQERFNKACEPGMDYVYKVRVEEMDLKPTIDIYNMKVEQVLKEGTDEDPMGKNRQFFARPSCRESLSLEKDKSYLIMGKYIDMKNLDSSPQYILGNNTWIENWAQEEGQTPPGIVELVKNLTTRGCTV